MAGRKQIEDLVAREANAVLADLGYELVGVDYYKQDGQPFIEITIYQPDGICLDDCERATPVLSELLDRMDILENTYNLMVSSPGDRPLSTSRDFERNIGQRVEIKLYVPINKKKLFFGNLKAWDEQIVIDDQGKTYFFDRKLIALVRPAFEP